MAKLEPGLNFTGKLNGLSFYKMHGSDNIIVRMAGGMSKERINKLPPESHIKMNNSEFGGCSHAGQGIRWAMGQVTSVADHNISAQVNKICKQIQVRDRFNGKGKRSVLVSENRFMLEGFNFSVKHSFASIVRTQLQFEINKVEGAAMIKLPQLIPGVNLKLPWNHSMYRFIISFGVIKDTVYNSDWNNYKSQSSLPHTDNYYSDWIPATRNFDGEQINLQLDQMQHMPDPASLILSIGIECGKVETPELIMPIKYAGSGVVLAVM